MPAKEPKREFKVGDKIRVSLHHGKIEDAVVRAASFCGCWNQSSSDHMTLQACVRGKLLSEIGLEQLEAIALGR